jgi:Amt family ammonium transporter
MQKNRGTAHLRRNGRSNAIHSPVLPRRGTTAGVWYDQLPLAILSAVLVRCGLAAFGVGLVRSKHAASTAGRAIVELCFAIFAYWLIGATFAEPGNTWGRGIINIQLNTAVGIEPWHVPQFMGMVAVVLVGGLLGGVLAERIRFWPVMIATAVLGAVVVPVAAGWTAPTGGFLAGRVTLAPVALPLIAASAFAWMALRAVGARLGKYRRDGSTALIPGHNLPLSLIGAMLAWLGLAVLAVSSGGADRVLPATAAAGVVASVVTQLKLGKPDIGLIVIGVLGSAVAVLCGAPALAEHHWLAVPIGAAAGAVVPYFAYLFELRLKQDDPSSQLAILGVGAAIGVLVCGPWAEEAGHWYVRLGFTAIGCGAAVAWGAVIGWATFAILKRTTKLRASEADEFDGLDLAEHDVSAYPDFQQNTIRSFHMREA